MQGLPATVAIASQSCTILRIKRKRNEEPLDALVVDSRVRRKKSRGGVGVFQYAQTVENDAWDDVQRQKDIQAKITQLSLETAAKAERQPLPTAADLVPPSPSHPPKDESTRRYTIVQSEQSRGPISRFPTSPPKVLSSKDIAKKPVDYKMYDAIPQQSLSTDESFEVNKFLPMLNDYLKIHDIDIGSETDSPALKKPSGVIVQPILPQSALEDGDYVWDVFYHRPATLSEWNEAANVGTLTGLPPSFGDVYDSASDSEEEEDEGDEDSNAEEYYKNDYPDEIDSSESSDEFHEDSEYEEYDL